MARRTSTLAVAAAAALALSPAAAQQGPPISGTPVQLWPCTPGAVRQTWTVTASGPPHDTVALGSTGLVLNVLGLSNASGAVLNAWSSVFNNAQQFVLAPAPGVGSLVVIRSEMSNLCAGTQNSSGALPAGTAVVQVPCADVTTAQWTYSQSTGSVSWAHDPTLCLDAGTAVTCADAPFSSYPYCNASLTAAERVEDLLPRLLPVEAAAMLSASNNGVPRLGVPALTYGEALHGVLSGCGKPYTDPTTGFTSTGCPTSFPTGLALGSTFNRSLYALVGDAIGQEARALANQNVANMLLFTPDINGFRDPRWGRGMEVPGEDPFHSGEYVASYSSAMQAGEGGPSGGYLRVVSFAKHSFAYDQEGNGGPHDRTNFCATIDPGYLSGYFWPAFKSAVVQGHVGGIMCSANGVNGLPTCAHSEFNNGVLRGEWGWTGAMVTDGNGVGYLYDTYGHRALGCVPVVASGPTDACRVGLRGGVDVELGETLNNYALAAIADGNITMDDITAALRRTLPYIFRLGLADPPSANPFAALGPADVDTPAHRQLALEAAQQSVILLRNAAPSGAPAGSPNVLPLSLSSLAGKTVAVIGPNANASSVMLANYHGINTLAASHTPLLALQALAAPANVNVAYAVGCTAGAPCNTSDGIQAAVAAAQGASVAVLFVGLAPSGGGPQPGTLEGEEFDRVNITLPGFQEALVEAVAATGTPVVLVIMRGGPVSLSAALLADARIAAIVDSPYPGELGGDALAAVLTGAVSPSGRLSTTVYPGDFVNTRSIIDYNMTSVEGITYQYYTGTPLFEFGEGLSYTSFSFAWMGGETGRRAVDAADAKAAGRARVAMTTPYAVNVTNTGGVTSDVSVLAFLTNPAGQQQPLKELFDFQRAAALGPGQSVVLYLSPPSVDVLATVEMGTGEMALTPGVYGVRIGAPGQWLAGSVEVVGERTVVFRVPEPTVELAA
jgi:xylan 1,4-beta-xylosidase